jgi:hypothetical protein
VKKVDTLDIIKKLNTCKITLIIPGIIIGIILSIAFDLIYIDIFHESSSTFYLFAGLALLGGPLAGGLVSALMAKENRPTALLISGVTVFVVILILSVLSYLVLPLFSYDSVRIPASGIDNVYGGSHLPSDLNYSIPGIGNGTLITSDNKSAVVAMTDHSHLPFKSTVYLINKSNNNVIQDLNFNNDIISAAIYQGTLYIFNDKIGYIINAENGEFEKIVVTIDNYRGLFTHNNNMYMQTTFEISSLNADGSVGSHRQMYMNCTAFGYFISGSTGQIIE